MSLVIKGAIWPSFFVFPGFLLALTTSTFEGYVFYWAGLVCIVFPVLIGLPGSLQRNALTFTVLIFSAWLLLHIFFLSPVFTTRGLYYVCFLLAGFLLMSSCSRDQVAALGRLVVVIFSLLALWALVQYATGYPYLIPAHSRVNTIFYTPNTFAAALNLVLVPLLVMYLAGKGGRWLFCAIVLLFAVLVLTQSRGGWLAFAAAMGVTLLVTRVTHTVKPDSYRIRQSILMVLVTVLLFMISNPVVKQYVRGKDILDFGLFSTMAFDTDGISRSLRIEGSTQSAKSRLKIYDIAWQRIKDKPFLGHGYNHFQYYQLRDQDLSRMGKLTRFVHNDYLQIWFETGLPGLILLLLLILVLYLSLLRMVQAKDARTPIALALMAAFTAYFAHALVDFVLYPPVLLLMFGALLGVSASLQGGETHLHNLNDRLARVGMRPALIRRLAGFVVLVLLVQPAVAQLLFDRANREKHRLELDAALTHYELARRFAAHEPAYYFIEGDIWRHAASVTGEAEPAERADRLFRRGAAVNPMRVESLYLRALLHRDQGQLLASPADEATVLAWFEEIMHWHPHDIPVKIEYLKTLQQYGREGLWQEKLANFRATYPESSMLKAYHDAHVRTEPDSF